jgi:hypothetical protein
MNSAEHRFGDDEKKKQQRERNLYGWPSVLQHMSEECYQGEEI